jgi:hypothetical protein
MNHIRKHSVFLILAFALLIPGGGLSAQGGGAISFDETVTGAISDETPAENWVFSGQAGQVVSLGMKATAPGQGALDAYLILLGPDGEVLAENDDDPNGTSINAALEGVELPADGDYTIQATRFGGADGTTSGPYELILILGEALPQVEVVEDEGEPINPILADETQTGALDATTFQQFWLFTGEQGQVISLNMTRISGDLDPLLRLLAANLSELTRNEDAGGDASRSEIANFELPYTGDYVIVAARSGLEGGETTGDYHLTVTVAGQTANTPAETEAPSEASDLGLQDGDFIQGSLPADALAEYAFQGTAGQVVTVSIKQTGPGLNPALAILGPDGSRLAENRDFNGPADARIRKFSLPSDGPYSVAVSGENSSSGDFVLHFFVERNPFGESASPASPPPTASAMEIEGALVIGLTWQGPADLDLSITEPGGDSLGLGSPESSAGGLFGGDANGGCEPSPSPMESATWAAVPASGAYSINVAHVFPCGAEGPVSYTVEVYLNGERVETFQGELAEGNDQTYEYTLP